MTKKQLLKHLNNPSIPDDAIVYVESDHGQNPNMAGGILYTLEDADDLPYFGQDVWWCEESELEEGDKITGVCIR